MVATSTMNRRPLAPYTILKSLPTRRDLQLLATASFLRHLKRRSDILRQRLQLYSASGLRMDGHFKLPTRVVTAKTLRSGKKKLIGGHYKVLLGFTGVDGALLFPPALARQERWSEISRVLKPYLEELLKTRLEAGYSLRDSIPSFHTTDNFRRDCRGLGALYREVWKGLEVGPDACRPKGSAFGAKVMQWLEDFARRLFLRSGEFTSPSLLTAFFHFHAIQCVFDFPWHYL